MYLPESEPLRSSIKRSSNFSIILLVDYSRESILLPDIFAQKELLGVYSQASSLLTAQKEGNVSKYVYNHSNCIHVTTSLISFENVKPFSDTPCI